MLLNTRADHAMKIAVVGPVCKDQNIVRGKAFPGTGGMTYYTGNALAALGANVTVYGYFGRKDLEIFNSFNCRLVHIPSEGTINFINEYHNISDSRTQRARIFNNQVLPEHTDQHLSDSDLIILGPLFGDNIPLDLFEKLGSIGKVALSVQGIIRQQEGDKIILKRPENLERILPHVDYLIMDEDELKIVTQKSDTQSGIEYLKENGARNIFVTQASRGSIISVEGKEYKIPAFPPKELVDPTGAGDSYLAGFIRALGLFDDPKKQGDFAAMTATLSLETHGHFKGTTEDVLKRLKSVKEYTDYEKNS